MEIIGYGIWYVPGGHGGIIDLIRLLSFIHDLIFETWSTRSSVARQWLTASLIIPTTSVVLVSPALLANDLMRPWPGMLIVSLLNVPELSLKSQKWARVLESRAWIETLVFMEADNSIIQVK